MNFPAQSLQKFGKPLARLIRHLDHPPSVTMSENRNKCATLVVSSPETATPFRDKSLSSVVWRKQIFLLTEDEISQERLYLMKTERVWMKLNSFVSLPTNAHSQTYGRIRRRAARHSHARRHELCAFFWGSKCIRLVNYLVVNSPNTKFWMCPSSVHAV